MAEEKREILKDFFEKAIECMRSYGRKKPQEAVLIEKEMETAIESFAEYARKRTGEKPSVKEGAGKTAEFVFSIAGILGLSIVMVAIALSAFLVVFFK